jgi:ribosome maturation factor RimP
VDAGKGSDPVDTADPVASVDVVGRVRTIAHRVVASHGVEIFDVQFRREAGGMVLRIRIDRPGPAATAEESVSVEDCANVSRDLSAILDVEEIVPSAYTLEVSSPGLDRPLRSADDYRRFTGRRAKVVMRAPVDGQTFLRGILGGIDEGHILIDAEDHKRHRVPLDSISRANLVVEF